MATFNSFEEIKAWQKARILCKLIYDYTLKNSFSRDFKLVSQIKGSSGSAMDNDYITEEEFQLAFNLADEVGKLIGGLMSHLKASELKGNKFK